MDPHSQGLHESPLLQADVVGQLVAEVCGVHVEPGVGIVEVKVSAESGHRDRLPWTGGVAQNCMSGQRL